MDMKGYVKAVHYVGRCVEQINEIYFQDDNYDHFELTDDFIIFHYSDLECGERYTNKLAISFLYINLNELKDIMDEKREHKKESMVICLDNNLLNYFKEHFTVVCENTLRDLINKHHQFNVISRFRRIELIRERGLFEGVIKRKGV